MIEKIMYSNSGAVTTELKEAVAKSSFNDESNHGRYYILFYRGQILNVRDAQMYKRFKADAKYRQVPKKAFDYYIKYISGKGESFLREAERSLV